MASCLTDKIAKIPVRGQIECSTGEYYDGVYKTCCSCEDVCKLDDTFCCRNCPDFCPVVKDLVPKTTTKTLSSENDGSASGLIPNTTELGNTSMSSAWLPALTISIVSVLALLFAALIILAMILFRKRKQNQRSTDQKLLQNNSILEKVEHPSKCPSIPVHQMQCNFGLSRVVCCSEAGNHLIGQSSDSGESSRNSLDSPDGRAVTNNDLKQFSPAGVCSGNIETLSACDAKSMILLSNEAQASRASSRVNDEFDASSSGDSAQIRSYAAAKTFSGELLPDCCCFNVDSECATRLN